MEDTTHFQDVEDSEDALSFCDPTTHFQDVADSEDALSFCDLPIYKMIRRILFFSNRFVGRPLNHNFQSHDDHPNPSCPDDDFFEFLPDPTADLVGWRSESLTPTAAAASRSRHMCGSYLSMKMTSPARSKKHACLFGLPKFPPEMELSYMRRRQSRRTSAPLLSTENDGEVVDGSARRESGPAEELLERGRVWLHFSSLKSV
ncbi:hypothetical protein CK203_062848 [Vitis vinifera]|uniref:Uncharacterized protein n=1 Tax=Vitis vinifera TaxID=29760 RepID=A0A438G8D9_VITVI|nr:hypothetical protein CK203_062848 [Vitis vinifera]